MTGVTAWAAPHTRGSTHLGQLAAVALDGCPAHAGIDPRVAAVEAATERLPRTRGDRPTQ